MECIQVSILVVDDDAAYLKIITKYLQKMNYFVTAMMDPVDALDTLRMRHETFNLVLTDVHMPHMSGLELLEHAIEEFQLPVVLMSVDCDKNIMLQGLENGASFYLMKPITQANLEKLWQFAVSGMTPSNETSLDVITSVEGHKGDVFNSINNQSVLKRTNNDITNVTDNNIRKKPKLIWTSSLHNLFLEAVNKIGIKKAMPKKILEYMNVPGLRRENVASHLQKYRIFLKRISELPNSSENDVLKNLDERPIRSSFVMNEITYLTNNLQQQYQEFLTEREKGPRKTLENSSEGTNPNCMSDIDNVAINPSNGATHTTNDGLQNAASTKNNIKNTQSTMSKYVGLRIGSSGELITTRNHSSTDYFFGDDNSNSNTPSDCTENDVVQTSNKSFGNHNVSQNMSSILSGTNDVLLGGVKERNFDGVINVNQTFGINNGIEQEILFNTPQEMSGYDMGGIRQVDIAVHFDHPRQPPFATDFGFGSFDHMHNYGVEIFEGFNQGLFWSDDILLENYYAEEFAQHCFGESNKDDHSANH